MAISDDPPSGDKWQRHALGRQQRQVYPQIDERLKAIKRNQPSQRQHLNESLTRVARNDTHSTMNVTMQIRMAHTIRSQLLADDRQDEVCMRVRQDMLGAPPAGTGAHQAAIVKGLCSGIDLKRVVMGRIEEAVRPAMQRAGM